MALACAGGCSREIANPFASFETRCASLPPALYQVVTVPLRYEEDDSVEVAELTARSGSSPETHRTFGLTTASFGHQTQSELRLVTQRISGRTCAVPQVKVELSMQPVTVYVARELAHDACRHEATREHELKHVEVDREVLDESAQRLREELPARLGTAALQGSSGAALSSTFETSLRSYMGAFMREQHALLTRRQAEIDSPAEYARVGSACQAH